MDDKTKMVALYMKKLGISKEEAEQMYQDEMEDNLPELTPEQAKVAKQMAQADRKKETEKRKRERKPDEAKRELLQTLIDTCTDISDPDTEINIITYFLEFVKREFHFL